MAGHDFQEGLKNYRDMSYLDGTLTRWEDSIEAFNDMIATRDTALAERLPQADALLAAQPLPPMVARRDAFDAQLESAQRTGDVSLLGTTTERAQWQQVLDIEQAIAAQPADDANAEQRAKLRLIKGVLYWRLNQQFKARMLDDRRQLKALETDLQESSERFDRLAGIRDQAGANRQEFTTRLTAMAERLNTLHARLKDTRTLQATYLAELGVHELQQQQERLGTYQVQARYSLAAIYDKAATPDLPAKKPAAEPAAAEPATEAAPAITPMPTPAPEPRP
jgi:hypothetical protein